jgi:penicillin-binding protein 2
VIAAPRGQIVDRNGVPLVANRNAVAVQVSATGLPASQSARRVMYRRLGRVLQVRAHTIEARVNRELKILPYAPVTIKNDAGPGILFYLKEHQNLFPGVQEPPVYLRQYPLGDVAAHLVGTVGEINPQELKLSRFRGVNQGTVVGQGGVEWSYDRYLRGQSGFHRVQIDAIGRARGLLSTTDPIAGKELRLSIDASLEREGQQAVQAGIGLAQGNGHPSKAGAFVAMDPRNGQVLALGSVPSFDPSVFAKPISEAQYRRLSSRANGAPLYDRAIAGLYPTGSTFKPITALAALQSGTITPSTPIDSPPCITIGAQQFCSAGKAAYGTLALPQALQVSSDVFFYTLGEWMNSARGQPLQTWAHKLGIGRPTGIDLPGEFHGLLPTPAWRAHVDRLELRCRHRRHVPSCGISDARPWSVGDNVNLAVGQGDLEATPLQMAVAYSTIVNDGKVVKPHLGMEVDDAAGRLIQRIDPGAARHVQFAAANRAAIMTGLHLAASAPGGTSADVFNGFPHPVYGKTGTAQHLGGDDQSWYVAYAPDPSRPIVVAVTIEKGGFGAEAAAPAARLILSEWFHVNKKLVAGHSRTL